MKREEKTALVERLREALADAPAVVVADFKGLTVEQTDELRSQFRKAGVHYEVVKNTLARRAVVDTDKESLISLFKGNTAIAFHPEDPTISAKIVRDFSKENEELSIKGGWLSGELLDVSGVQKLATMPGKDELRGKLLSVVVGAPTKLVRTIIAAPQTFVRLLSARQQQLEAQA